MEVVHINDTDTKNRRLHTCNVCDSISSWTDGHRYVERMVGKGYRGYEVQFVTCSDDCRKSNEYKEKYIKWLGSKECWSKKSAEENFDQLTNINHRIRIKNNLIKDDKED